MGVVCLIAGPYCLFAYFSFYPNLFGVVVDEVGEGVGEGIGVCCFFIYYYLLVAFIPLPTLFVAAALTGVEGVEGVVVFVVLVVVVGFGKLGLVTVILALFKFNVFVGGGIGLLGCFYCGIRAYVCDTAALFVTFPCYPTLLLFYIPLFTCF